MKAWLIPFPCLFAAGLATAAAPVSGPIAPSEAPAVTAQAVPAPPAKAKRHNTRPLPKGDLRKCLELKDNKAIIACAEKRSRK